MPGLWMHCDERSLQRLVAGRLVRSLALLDLGDRVRDFGLRRLLHLQIDRRVDLESALVDQCPAETLHEETPNSFLKVLAVVFAGYEPITENDRGFRRRIVGGPNDHPRMTARLQHDITRSS